MPRAAPGPAARSARTRPPPPPRRLPRAARRRRAPGARSPSVPRGALARRHRDMGAGVAVLEPRRAVLVMEEIHVVTGPVAIGALGREHAGENRGAEHLLGVLHHPDRGREATPRRPRRSRRLAFILPSPARRPRFHVFLRRYVRDIAGPSLFRCIGVCAGSAGIAIAIAAIAGLRPSPPGGRASARKRASHAFAARPGGCGRMRRLSGGKAAPGSPVGPAPTRSRRSAAAAMRAMKRRSSAWASSSTGSSPAASRTARSMPARQARTRSALRRALRFGRGPPQPGGRRVGEQCVQRQHPALFGVQPVEGLDLLAQHDRVPGQRVVPRHAPAPAAGVGQHMRQRLEVDVGRRHALRIARPVEPPPPRTGAAHRLLVPALIGALLRRCVRSPSRLERGPAVRTLRAGSRVRRPCPAPRRARHRRRRRCGRWPRRW